VKRQEREERQRASAAHHHKIRARRRQPLGRKSDPSVQSQREKKEVSICPAGRGKGKEPSRTTLRLEKRGRQRPPLRVVSIEEKEAPSPRERGSTCLFQEDPETWKEDSFRKKKHSPPNQRGKGNLAIFAGRGGNQKKRHDAQLRLLKREADHLRKKRKVAVARPTGAAAAVKKNAIVRPSSGEKRRSRQREYMSPAYAHN